MDSSVFRCAERVHRHVGKLQCRRMGVIGIDIPPAVHAVKREGVIRVIRLIIQYEITVQGIVFIVERHIDGSGTVHRAARVGQRAVGGAVHIDMGIEALDRELDRTPAEIIGGIIVVVV